MIYILIIILVYMLVISYFINGKDLFAPGTAITICFLFSIMSALYNIKKWKFDLSLYTFLVLVSIIFISIIINSMIHEKYKRLNCKKSKKIKITPINDKISPIIILFELILIIVMIANIFKISGAGKVSEIMVNYRQETAYNADVDSGIPNYIRQLLNVSSVLCYIYLFDLLYFYRESSTNHIVFDVLVIMLSIIANLLTGGRFSTMAMMIGAFIMWYLITMKKENNEQIIDIKRLSKIIVCAILLLYAFYAVKTLVGRDSKDNLLDYITHYAGGSIPGLDYYFKDPPRESNILGKETFYSLINGLRKLKILKIEYYYVHHEFRQSNGYSIGNIYTAVRDYHYDFGIVGMYILHILFSAFISFMYERTKKFKTPMGIIILGTIYYSLVFYSISNCFYANIISFGFGIRIILLYFFYKVLLEKKNWRKVL